MVVEAVKLLLQDIRGETQRRSSGIALVDAPVTMLDVALDCIRRGWYVFPCQPRSSAPWTANGARDASNDEAQIRLWWKTKTDANVGIATGPSGLIVLDVDHGIADAPALARYCKAHGLPATYTTRTGRRPGFSVQMYYRGEGVKSSWWVDPRFQHISGEIRAAGGYVMSAGCVHSTSGELYRVMYDDLIAPVPDFIRSLKSVDRNLAEGGTNLAVQDDGVKVTSHHIFTTTALLGRFRNAGHDHDAVKKSAVAEKEVKVEPLMSEADSERIAPGVLSEVRAGDEPVSGAAEAPKLSVDWQKRYMSEDDFLNIKPAEFLIDGFLARQSVTMLTGPVGQRKSAIALNIAYSLCTGKPLFGRFPVNGGHKRVIYLASEMSRAAFARRIRDIGLGPCVAKTLFVQTMDEVQMSLDDLKEELPGAVLIVDTIDRFIEGEEDSSEDIRAFTAKILRLRNAGATVILLHHSKKGASGSQNDGLRGSFERAPFLDGCWETHLEDPKNPDESLSLVRNTNQRDSVVNPFRLRFAPCSALLMMEGEPALEPKAAVKGKADDAAFEELQKLLAADPKMGINKLCVGLRSVGRGRGSRWVKMARATLLSDGVTATLQ